MNEAEQHQQAINEQLKVYARLNRINKSQEFNDFFDLIQRTVADKMIWAFTGDNIKTIDDFYKIRGEIISYLYPLQEIRGAEALSKQLKEQLESYYGSA
jgi:hypothetical protein